MEELVGRTLADLLRQQRLSPRDLERRLDLPAASLDRLLAGRGSLDMDVLRRLLTLVGATPESFFARVFAQGAATEPAAGNGPGRQQVAGLIDRVRAALAEIRDGGPEPLP